MLRDTLLFKKGDHEGGEKFATEMKRDRHVYIMCRLGNTFYWNEVILSSNIHYIE